MKYAIISTDRKTVQIIEGTKKRLYHGRKNCASVERVTYLVPFSGALRASLDTLTPAERQMLNS